MEARKTPFLPHENSMPLQESISGIVKHRVNRVRAFHDKVLATKRILTTLLG
jgi:hypothetical protein